MATPICNFTSHADLSGVQSLPQDNLTALVSECYDNICKIVYGTGNPDLAGIGVIVSYAVQLILGIVFGPAMMLDLLVLPMLLSNHSPKKFTSWLGKKHETCLWSQLLFSLAISIASCLHQYQAGTFVYENAVMIFLVALTGSTFLSTASAFFFPTEKLGLFLILVVVCGMFTTFTWLAPAIRGLPFEGIFRICWVVAKERGYAPNNVLIAPYNSAITSLKVMLVVVAIASFIFLWVHLRRRGPRWEGKLSRLESIDLFTRICAVLMFVLSIVLVLFSFLALFVIMYMRRAMLQIWNGDTGEDRWGFGQVSALFVWAPLFVEIGESALKFLGGYCRWKRRKSEDTRARVISEELGMPLIEFCRSSGVLDNTRMARTSRRMSV